MSQSRVMEVHHRVEDDLRPINHHHLDQKDSELRIVYKSVKRKFFLKRFLRDVTIEKETSRKSHGKNSPVWYQKVQVRNITSEEVESIRQIVRKSELNVAITLHKQDESDLWDIELI